MIAGSAEEPFGYIVQFAIAGSSGRNKVVNHQQRIFCLNFGKDGIVDLKVEPDPAEQAALAEIRRLRSQGMTLRGIAAPLNHRAFQTRRGTAWRLESVARVINQNAGGRHSRMTRVAHEPPCPRA